ncbi:MAG: transcriptional regulator [Treponema sp.]|nr:transcriptional regulator [Treponema sp.]
MENFQPNKIIHEPPRLKIMVLLASDKEHAVTFPDIKDALGMSSGNLSVQLKTLENAGYISMEKYIDDNKSRTDVSITPAGKEALIEYMESLERFLSRVKK